MAFRQKQTFLLDGPLMPMAYVSPIKTVGYTIMSNPYISMSAEERAAQLN